MDTASGEMPLGGALAREVFGDSWVMADMHCHLDFAPNARELALAAERRGVAAFSNTVTPNGFLGASRDLAGLANVRVGAGLHPWWVADGSCGARDIALACDLARESPFVGEVGLDFAPRREGTFDRQFAAFEAVVRACAPGGKVLSIHAVRSAQAVLDVLEREGTTRSNACILHWFSGSSQELTRAIALGCHFSVNPRMLQTKRGRAYARQIPRDRLLLETDLPEDTSEQPYDASLWLDVLASTAEMLDKV